MSKSQINIDWQWWDSQVQTREALSSGEYDLVVFRGGYGSGKTILGVRWIIETALRIAKSDNLIIAPDSQKGGPTTYKAFFKELPGENTVPEEGGDPENSPIIDDYHRVNRRATFINGSVVRLGSADVWNRYAGGEFNAIYCDEVAHYETTNLYDLHEMLVTRQRTEGGPNVTLWTSTGNGYNQFYDITAKHESSEGEPLPWRDSLTVIQANTLDNPFLPEDAREKMRRQFGDSSRAEQALKGGFAEAEGRVYNRFTKEAHEVSDSEYTLSAESDVIYGYDHGWKDPRVLVQLQQTNFGQWVVTDEYYETEAHLSEAVEWLQSRKDGVVYCEHEPEHIEKFIEAGMGAETAIKDLDEGIPFVRELLDTDNDRPGLLVDENCVNTVGEFMTYKEEHVGKSNATDHALDALRYALYTHEQQAGLLLGYE